MDMHKIEEATAYLARRGYDEPDYALILGSGLDAFLKHFKEDHRISYQSIPHFPVATMDPPGHLLCGQIAGHKIVVMKGRFHFYEAYSLSEIVFPVRVMKLLGARKLLLSNAAGALNPDLQKGDIVRIVDHLNLLGESPLRGYNLENLDPRFPDLYQAYCPEMGAKLEALAQSQGLKIKQGVYASVPGPNLETPAECRYLQIIGADMVGMSTVPEVIAAAHMGLPCLAVSVISNRSSLLQQGPAQLDEALSVASKADQHLSRLFYDFIASDT